MPPPPGTAALSDRSPNICCSQGSRGHSPSSCTREASLHLLRFEPRVVGGICRRRPALRRCQIGAQTFVAVRAREDTRLPPARVKRVCIYCGSSPGSLAEYAAAARHCGAVLAGRKLAVVYGGGNVGLMGILADAALAAGGEVIGVIPRRMIARELAHERVTSLIPVDSMHERKQKMADLSDAFIALPGGIGTMEELFEAFT